MGAGRVQSVALRLVCEREAQIEVFSRQEYWSVTAQLQSEKGPEFEARLVQASLIFDSFMLLSSLLETW